MTVREHYDPDSLDNRDPKAIEALLAVLDPMLERFYQPQVRGLTRIPDGPALYVQNHNAGVLMPDAWAVGSAIYKHGGLEAVPFVLAHDLALRPAALNRALCPIGAVRARPDTASRIFAAGHKALVFPGGDLEVLRPFAHRDRIVFGRRRGYIKQALRSGVPIVPIVTAGAHSSFIVLDDGGNVAKALGLPKLVRVNVLPTVLSFPWGLTFGFPPPYVPLPTRMYSEILAPIHFSRSGESAAADEAYVEACHERVVTVMQRALDRLARERREVRRQRVAAKALELFDRGVAALGLSAPGTSSTVEAPAAAVTAARPTDLPDNVVRLSDHRHAA